MQEGHAWGRMGEVSALSARKESVMSTLAERYHRRKDNGLVDVTTMASVKLGLLLGDAERHRRIDDLLESVGYVSVLNVGALDLKVWADHHDLNTEAEFLRRGLDPEYAIEPLFDEWKRQGIEVDCGKNSLFLYVPGYESVHDRPTVILPDVPPGLPWRALTGDRKAAIAGNIRGFFADNARMGIEVAKRQPYGEESMFVPFPDGVDVERLCEGLEHCFRVPDGEWHQYDLTDCPLVDERLVGLHNLADSDWVSMWEWSSDNTGIIVHFQNV